VIRHLGLAAAAQEALLAAVLAVLAAVRVGVGARPRNRRRRGARSACRRALAVVHRSLLGSAGLSSPE
jgi:hypothetical protein